MPAESREMEPCSALDARLCALRRWLAHTPLILVVAFGLPASLIATVIGMYRWEMAIYFPAMASTLLLVVVLRVTMRAQQRVLRTFEELGESESVEKMERLLHVLAGAPIGKNSPTRLRLEGAIEMARGRWNQARDIYTRIDLRRVYPEKDRILTVSLLALTTALAGNADAALPIAREAARLADNLRAHRKREKTERNKLRRNVRTNLGACLTLAGQHAEAMTTLKPLLDEKTEGRTFDLRSFFYGKALVGSGSTNEGFARLEKTSGGVSSWAKRARKDLDARAALPHRS